jgi:hypothetical protein
VLDADVKSVVDGLEAKYHVEEEEGKIGGEVKKSLQ